MQGQIAAAVYLGSFFSSTGFLGVLGVFTLAGGWFVPSRLFRNSSRAALRSLSSSLPSPFLSYFLRKGACRSLRASCRSFSSSLPSPFLSYFFRYSLRS